MAASRTGDVVSPPRSRGEWAQRFAKALEQRRAAGLGTPETATAYRLAHGTADGVGDWVVDVYDRHLVAQSYAEDPAAEAPVLDALEGLGFAGVYLKRRPRQANVVGERERRERAPARAARGQDAPEAFHVVEGGLRYEVRLGEGFSTGVFLDQRPHRARLRALGGVPGFCGTIPPVCAADLGLGARSNMLQHVLRRPEADLDGASSPESHRKNQGHPLGAGRVLNLFAYTCGFGVAAAAGGAETINVDLSRRALEWGKRNYAANQLPLAGQRFLARDAFEFLERADKRGEQYDVVVLDPPSYARRPRGRFNTDRDWVGLCAAALRITRSGGQLLACTNQQRLPVGTFAARVRRAAEEAGAELGPVRVSPLAEDFPVVPGGTPHLKACWLTPR